MTTAAEQAGAVIDARGAMLETLELQRKAFRAEGFVQYGTRIDRIERCIALLVDNQEAICSALSADYGCRSPYITRMAEIMTSVGNLKHVKKKLKSWMKPERRSAPVPMNLFGARALVYHQPKGVVGNMTPWNIPVGMVFSPMADILGAGNRVMIKPSEFTPQTSELTRELIGRYFDRSEIAVMTGGPEVGAAFASLPFDHLLFTGATAIGRMVMRAAAENLTPVTLEMGGKSPTLIGERFPMARAVQSILMGKLLNAGQTCIAPDYLLLPKARLQEFLEVATAAILERYPRVVDNPDITWIINERHHQRILGLIEDARDKGARIHELNPGHAEIPAGVRVIAPTLLYEVTDQMRVMQEEIFGPLLPIVTYDSLDQAIDYVNRRPRPLALYLFEEDDDRIRRVVNGTISGGVCVNDTMLHIAHQNLPFGGIGPSGLGAYHGFDGFVEFSHKKAVLYQGRFSPAALLKPPYNERALKVLNWVARRLA